MALRTLHKTGMNQDLVIKLFNEIVDWTTEVDADLNTINDRRHYLSQRDGVTGGTHTLGVGTDTSTDVRMSGQIRYRISGVEYVAQDIEVTLATGEITHNTNGAWRITINKLGVLGTQRATANGTSGTMAFASAESALLSLSQIARTAATVDVGYLMIHATNGAGGFTPGTDDPAATDAQVDVATYYNCRVPRIDNSLTADPSVGLSEGGTNTHEFAFGTINVRNNGLNLAQIAADTDEAFEQNDTIGAVGQYGGHLFITDTAGTAVISLAANGIAGAVAAMAYTTQALVTAALDAVQLALPQIYTVIGRETTVRVKVASFVYNTDDVAGTDGTATWTDETSGTYDRTDTTHPGVGIDLPAIPATVTASSPSRSQL